MRQLQAGVEQIRLPHALAASVLMIALALLSRPEPVRYAWASIPPLAMLPITVAAASARRLQKNRSIPIPNVASEAPL